MAIDPERVVVLVPNRFGGLDVTDVAQLMSGCDDEYVESVDDLLENAGFDMTNSGYAVLQGDEVKMGGLEGFGRIIVKVRQLNETGDVSAYHTTQDWEK